MRSDPNLMSNTVIDPERICSFLNTRYLGSKIVCFDVTESTNTSAREFGNMGYPSGTVVLADRQTGGRGRRERKWESKPGENMLMSVLLRPSVRSEVAPRFTIAAAVGVYRAMVMHAVRDVRIKWPNDIVIGHKKLAGILLECSATVDGIKHLTVGIGLNVNTETFDGDIRDTAVSMLSATGRRMDREQVTADVLNQLEPLFDMCETDTGFSELMEEYTRASAVYGKRVTIVQETGTRQGTVTGFDALGRIEMDSDTGEHLVFDSGDVSLRYDF